MVLVGEGDFYFIEVWCNRVVGGNMGKDDFLEMKEKERDGEGGGILGEGILRGIVFGL